MARSQLFPQIVLMRRHAEESVRFADSIVGTAVPVSAILRMSSVIFIEQYFGPHMLQKWALLNVSCGSVSS